MAVRSSGVLLHITCLFNRFGIGDLGPGAYRYADQLTESGQNTWQVLPMNPTDPGHGNSPYHSISAFPGFGGILGGGFRSVNGSAWTMGGSTG
jgi:4-alpha-glucanotransferase